MPRLFVATTNRDKLREVGAVLAQRHADLVSLADLPPVVEPEETGETFDANARLKALYYDEWARGVWRDPTPGTLTVAEDSGLVVDALDGEPGVHSARFLGPDASYTERFAELYRRLRLSEAVRPWTARFVCALAVVDHGRVVFEARGVVEGVIADHPAGSSGFGYDPIFLFPPYGRTLAEVDDARKLAVAHRGEAFRVLDRWLFEAYPY